MDDGCAILAVVLGVIYHCEVSFSVAAECRSGFGRERYPG